LQAQGEYEGAVKSFDKALETEARWTPALAGKMNALLALGRDREAADILIRL